MRPIFKLLYLSYRLTTSVRYWLLRRFTTAGLVLLLATALVLPLSFDTDNNVTYQALCLLITLLFFAVAFGWWMRGRYQVERILPRFCTVGAPIQYRVSIRNLARQPQAGLTYIETFNDLRPSLNEWIAFQWAEEKRLRRIPIWRRRMRHPFRVARVRFAEIPEGLQSR